MKQTKIMKIIKTEVQPQDLFTWSCW